jgi:hypothetical protein
MKKVKSISNKELFSGYEISFPIKTHDFFFLNFSITASFTLTK